MAFPGQTIAYQLTVSESFDGSTLPESAPSAAGEGQFYEAAQREAGLFPINDPGPELAQTSRGNRWMTWIEVRLDSPGEAGAAIEIVDNTSLEGTTIVLKQVADLEGQSLVYIDRGVFMPQGAVLRVRSLNSGGILRYHVTFLDPQSLALVAALSVLPDASVIPYTANPADWVAPVPDFVGPALTRAVASLAALVGPIPEAS